MTSYCEFKNQVEAIKAATADAKEYEAHTGERGESAVLLANGDTLTIRVSNRRAARSVSCGWNRSGVLYGSRRVLAIAQR